MSIQPESMSSWCTGYKRFAFRSISGAIAISILAATPSFGADNLASLKTTLEFSSTGNYELLGSINDLTTLIEDNDGNTQTFFENFSGTLNGKNFSISNLEVPLFNNLSGAVVSNLTLSTSDLGITGTGTTGILARTTSVITGSGTPDIVTNIENVHVIGIINSSFDKTGGLIGDSVRTVINSSSSDVNISALMNIAVGGLVGADVGGTISSSTSTNTVSGYAMVGGLAGIIDHSSILQSTSSATVTGGNTNIGGLVGLANASSISNSTARGAVFGDGDAGGLVGSVHDGSTITSSSAKGNVAANTRSGGLVGTLENASVNSSTASGSVSSSGSEIGGLIGLVFGGAISNSAARGDVRGDVNVGGLIGLGVLTDRDMTITTSNSIGNISGNSSVGGLVGRFSGSISNSNTSGSVSELNPTDGANFGGLVGYVDMGSITNSTSEVEVIATNKTNVGALIGNAEPMTTTILNSFARVAGASEEFGILETLNTGLEGNSWGQDSESFINEGKPYLIVLQDSDFYSDTTPDPEPNPESDAPTYPPGGSGSITRRISPEEIAKRESAEQKILVGSKSGGKRIEVEDFKSAGIEGATERSLTIIVELLAELESETFDAPTIQKVVEIAGAISRIISVEQGNPISFIDLRKVGVVGIEYSELKDFSKFLALTPANKKNSIKEIQQLVVEFKKNKAEAEKARQAKNEANRIQREKNLQLIFDMFKK